MLVVAVMMSATSVLLGRSLWRLKRLQHGRLARHGGAMMLTPRAAMSTVKIPRKLYEIAVQAWSRTAESAGDRWRRVTRRTQVAKLEPRLEVGSLSRPLHQPLADPATAAAANTPNTVGHDIVSDDIFDSAFSDDRLSTAVTDGAVAPPTPASDRSSDQTPPAEVARSVPHTKAMLSGASASVAVEEKIGGLEQMADVGVSEIVGAAAPPPPPPPPQAAAVTVPTGLPSVASAASLSTLDDIDARSRHLIRAIQSADLPSVLTKRLEEFSNHVLRYPDCRPLLINDKALSVLLRVKMESRDEPVRALTRECLSLLGYVQPPRAPGIRILSIDGGGVRGLLVIEVLRQLEICTGKRICELFDYVVGVSTGAILVGMLTALQKDLDECHQLYSTMSSTVFQQSSWWGTGKLVWNHAYYDTTRWQEILKELYGELTMIHSSRLEGMPRVGILSAIVNRQQLLPHLFRNYQLPPKEESYYVGSCVPRVWEAVRASSSAPFYFEEFHHNGDVHQDGGIIQNNPIAAAIHEARLLWPNEKIQCVVSIGSGRYIPKEGANGAAARSTSLKTKILKIVDSATDTEAVHTLCGDLLPPGTYFRFNPYLSEPFTLDETRPEKMENLRLDAQMYLRRNAKKFEHAAELLVQPRGLFQRCKDYLRENLQERLV